MSTAAPVSEEKFLQIYGTVLVRTWDDTALKQRFLANPVEVLKEFGLDAGTATIKVIEPRENPDPALCTPQSAVKLWNDGLQSGTITFVYPKEMPEGAEGVELSAEQMAAVAGGDACCCCSPCCSCCC
ncbi:MAG: hypothetical protein HY791_20730 [Deltaproteobacteria bacterium]|nr:hypothetical protein [Deltaproteobacteria bacterium]